MAITSLDGMTPDKADFTAAPNPGRGSTNRRGKTIQTQEPALDNIKPTTQFPLTHEVPVGGFPNVDTL